ncbi:MAG TPA: TIGR00730 family Rossman fold protein [Cyclobacteriaceae bacterium]|jgi:hypothetical protein
MKKICVFCGSNSGFSEVYRKSTIELAELIVERQLEIVYGGGNVGLMGILADHVLQGGGLITGVIPHFLAAKEVGHDRLTKMIFVDSMHERKQKMSELADGFIALPGGFGTLEELAEILTWAQLGLIQKPVGLLNVDKFYSPLILQLDMMVEKGFLKTENRQLLLADATPSGLLLKMDNFIPVKTTKWISKDET